MNGDSRTMKETEAAFGSDKGTVGAVDIPLVSIVVPTRNSETHLAQCLEALAAQSYPRVELIVIDNDSGDRTRDIAARYTDRIFTKGPERSAQLNFGFGVAGGKYVY